MQHLIPGGTHLRIRERRRIIRPNPWNDLSRLRIQRNGKKTAVGQRRDCPRGQGLCVRRTNHHELDEKQLVLEPRVAQKRDGVGQMLFGQHLRDAAGAALLAPIIELALQATDRAQTAVKNDVRT